MRLDARGHDLLLKNLPADRFLAGFWAASCYQIMGKGENGTAWNIHRGVCSSFPFCRSKPYPFLPSRLPPSPVFTEQPKQLCLVQVVSAFPECGAQSWTQRVSWSLASAAERGTMASCVACSTPVLLLRRHQLHAAFCCDSRGSFQRVGRLRSQRQTVRLSGSEGRARKLHVSCWLQTASMVCHCCLVFQSPALRFL